MDIRLKNKHVFKSKRDNATIPRVEKRNSWITLLVMEDGSSKPNEYYNLRKRYEVLRVGGDNLIIKKRKCDDGEFKFIIAFEEVYAALLR